MAPAGLLLEREAELALLGALLDRARGGDGAAAVIEGPPGIGKTALLRKTAELATANGFTVLQARASQLEQGFTFGVARQLLERRVRQAASAEQRRLLSGVAEDARPALGLGGAQTDSGLQSMHGLYWLVANLAGDGPLLLAVDDAHWADGSSLRWLVYMAQRLAGLPLALLVTSRLSEPGAEQDLLDALTLDDVTQPVRLAPLSQEAVGVLVGAGLPGAAAPEFDVACHDSTGGNPLLVRELLRELAANGVRPTDVQADSLGSFGIDAVARSVRRRIGAVGCDAHSVADAVAVFGDGPSVAEVAALTGYDESVVREAAVALAAVDVLRGDSPLVFVHPLVQSSVYDSIPAVHRSALHRSVAGLRDALSDPEAVAVHLLRVEPRADRQVVEILRAAAASVTGRGAPDAAATFLRRALQEPPGDEVVRAEVLVELGEAEAAANLDGFEPHLSAAIQMYSDRSDHAKAAAIALSLGTALLHVGAWGRSFEVLEKAWPTIDPDSDLAALIEAEMLAVAHTYPPVRPRIAGRVNAYRRRLARGEPIDAVVLGGLVAWLLRDEPPADVAVQAAETVLADFVRGGGTPRSTVMAKAHYVLVGASRLTRAGALCDDMAAVAQRRGWPLVMAWTACFSSDASFRQGEVIKAEGQARVAWDIGVGGPGLPPRDARLRATAAGLLINALVARGELAEAQSIDDVVGTALPERPDMFLAGRAELRLAQGRTEEAVADLQEVGTLLDGEFHKPVQNWRLRLAVALASTGVQDEARALTIAELEQARRWQVPLVVGQALVGLGVVTSSVETLSEAVTVLEGTEGRLDHALALIELGALLRRSGSPAAAREPLRAGMDLAARCGATAYADRAHEELVAAGSRPRRDRRFLTGAEALTAGEFRVAALAATGLTNREIAQRLYVTQAAVQFHLRNTFRKLGIAARSELGEALNPPMTPAKT
jgi:DNA-binding CsgD family transcriptional regulator